ncbi:MAG: hypothetical protein R3F43_22765 [bacterium]
MPGADPGERPADAAALRDELESCSTGGGTVPHQVRATGKTLRTPPAPASSSGIWPAAAGGSAARPHRGGPAPAVRSPDEVEAAWAQADRLRDLEEELEQAFDDAVARFHQVLAEEPFHASAHDGLRDLLWYRFPRPSASATRPDDGLSQPRGAARSPGSAAAGPGGRRHPDGVRPAPRGEPAPGAAGGQRPPAGG